MWFQTSTGNTGINLARNGAKSSAKASDAKALDKNP